MPLRVTLLNDDVDPLLGSLRRADVDSIVDASQENAASIFRVESSR
jgi:hypothetical protein